MVRPRRPRLSFAQAPATLLERLLLLRQSADAELARFFREHPGIGQRDRAVLADIGFDVLRNRRLYEHLLALEEGQAGDGRTLRGGAAEAIANVGAASPTRGTGAATGSAGPVAAGTARRLALLSPAAQGLARDEDEAAWLERIARIDRSELPAAVRLSLPDWLATRLEQCFGAAGLETLGAALLAPAALDLRVNPLKADVGKVLAALAEAGIEAQRLASAPHALRVIGKPALRQLAAYEAGWFEVQDLGSQLLCGFAAPRRGQVVIDFCAGAGGKTLAMIAAMRSVGQIYACDTDPRRLARLRPRLARSGADRVELLAIEHESDPRLARLAGRADLVLVDAPCSGTGTLRRNPDLKWRLTPADITRYAARQYAILAAAARLVRPGGALVYATCSLLDEENDAIATRFEAATGGHWSRDPKAGDLGVLRLRPDQHDCDGFFAVRWRRGGQGGAAMASGSG